MKNKNAIISDNISRCHWVKLNNPTYVKYHDTEWGRPTYDDNQLFEMLMLETFQAGLSWECILNRRDAFRRAFDNFDMHKIVKYDDAKLNQLYNDSGIIRNVRKINATVNNARVFMNITAEFGTFSKYLWGWTNGQIIYEYGETRNAVSDKIANDLRARGMRFVGTTTVYAYLQSAGVINSHEPMCHLYHK